jgi:hypothetical protein
MKKSYFIFKSDHSCDVLKKLIILDSNNSLKISVNNYISNKKAVWFSCPHCKTTGVITDQSLVELFLKSGIKYDQL